MAKGRTISASHLTELDEKTISICKDISRAIESAIGDHQVKRQFRQDYGKTSLTRDSGAGRGGGKLQRDALCTRGRTERAPYSNRNLRWHPLVVSQSELSFATNIEEIEIEGEGEQQTLVFVVKNEAGKAKRYAADQVYQLPCRFVCLPEHWQPHLDVLRHWSDNNWTQNSCVISASECCDWWNAVETYATLGISIAANIYGVDFDAVYDDIEYILEHQEVDSAIALPSPQFQSNSNMLLCPLCLKPFSDDLDQFRSEPRERAWQPAWKQAKKGEGDDSSLQIMHVDPIRETEIRHNAGNVRYGHRWCNVSMTDHSIAETLSFFDYVLNAHLE